MALCHPEWPSSRINVILLEYNFYNKLPSCFPLACVWKTAQLLKKEAERENANGGTETQREWVGSSSPVENQMKKRESRALQSQREKGFHSLLNTTPSGGGRAVYSFSNKSECLCLWISLTHWKQTSDVCTLQRQIWQWIKDITVCFLSCDLDHCFGFTPVCVKYL